MCGSLSIAIFLRPKVKLPKRDSLFLRAAHTLGHKIFEQIEAMKVYVVTLITPKCILTWALWQMLGARKLMKVLEQELEAQMRGR